MPVGAQVRSRHAAEQRSAEPGPWRSQPSHADVDAPSAPAAAGRLFGVAFSEVTGLDVSTAGGVRRCDWFRVCIPEVAALVELDSFRFVLEL